MAVGCIGWLVGAFRPALRGGACRLTLRGGPGSWACLGAAAATPGAEASQPPS
jgi:hypothetical protein